MRFSRASPPDILRVQLAGPDRQQPLGAIQGLNLVEVDDLSDGRILGSRAPCGEKGPGG